MPRHHFKLTCGVLIPYLWRLSSILCVDGSTSHTKLYLKCSNLCMLCLLGIGGATYISYEICFGNHVFTFWTSSLKLPTGGALCCTRRLPNSGPS